MSRRSEQGGRSAARPELPPALSRREMARWTWRQLTSMRTALVLLLLLSVAAVPGSLLPQRVVDPRAVTAFLQRNPELGPILDRLSLFDVYSSPWFSGIYLLLMISLVGCIVPRTRVYAKALRSRPPKVPRRLERFRHHESFVVDVSVPHVMHAAREVVRRERADVTVKGDLGELSSERGYLREAGNLIFHLSIIVVLVGVAGGALLSSRGAAIVVEGDTFSNARTQYDEFSAGTMFSDTDLVPFSLTLDDFASKFQTKGPQRGAPRMFRATGSYDTGTGPRPFDITVNNPLNIDGTSVYLVGNGYAPVIRVTDPGGKVVFDEPVPFLPVDPSYTSNGVVKVAAADPQLGFQGFFLPTAVSSGSVEASFSAFPAAANPLIGLLVWRGDLGLDDGTPQSVYTLDKRRMTQYRQKNGKPLRISLTPGTEADLPDGGKIEFVELRQFARLQIGSAPFALVPLTGISVGLFGLMLSLYVKPRRTWIRARGGEDSPTVVDVAILHRTMRAGGLDDLQGVVARLRERIKESSSPDPDDPSTRSDEPE